MNILKIILLIIALPLHAMEQLIPQENSEPSQIFLGHWENNTSRILFFDEHNNIFAKLPPKPSQGYKKFLETQVTPPHTGRPFPGLKVENNRYIYISPNNSIEIKLRISKRMEDQIVINTIQASIGLFLHEYLKKDFPEGLRIFIHGKIESDILDKATITCTYCSLRVPSLQDFAINAVLKNKLSVDSLSQDIKESIDDFKTNQKEKNMKFCDLQKTD